MADERRLAVIAALITLMFPPAPLIIRAGSSSTFVRSHALRAALSGVLVFVLACMIFFIASPTVGLILRVALTFGFITIQVDQAFRARRGFPPRGRPHRERFGDVKRPLQ
jgi:hypothetical protein